MNNVSQIFAAIGVILAVLVAVGAGLTLVRGSYNKARIQALREDNEDLRARVGDVEEKLEQSEAREAVLSAKVEHVESENQLLTALVTQKANVDEVLSLLNTHHEAAMQWMAKLTAAIVDLGEQQEKREA